MKHWTEGDYLIVVVPKHKLHRKLQLPNRYKWVSGDKEIVIATEIRGLRHLSVPERRLLVKEEIKELQQMLKMF